MNRVLTLLFAALLAACANAKPDPVVSPQLDSGITSDNGGGMRALRNQPNVGVNNRATP